jgi:hypothetical protein
MSGEEEEEEEAECGGAGRVTVWTPGEIGVRGRCEESSDEDGELPAEGSDIAIGGLVC